MQPISLEVIGEFIENVNNAAVVLPEMQHGLCRACLLYICI